MGPASPDKPLRAPRVLGFWMCLALVLGNMIGSGVYLLPAALAPYGWSGVLGWVVTIAGSLCLAFVFARLARSFPKAGGPYAYSRLAFGEGAAFALAWSYWISVWVANAAIAIAAVSYLSLFAPALGGVEGVPALLAIGFIWLLTLVNCLSVRAAGGVQLLTTILKLLPLVGAIILAFLVGVPSGTVPAPPFEPEAISGSAITAAAALTLWAMLGFEAATIPAGKVENPERIIPRATLLGTLIAGGIYLLACSAVALLLPPEVATRSNAPFADFIGLYLGSGVALAVALFAAVSALGALNGWVLIQGEMPLALARDGIFPRWFAKTSTTGTPIRAHIVSTGLATILILFNHSRSMGEIFVFMALLSTAAALITYLICALAALRLAGDGRMERSLPLVGAAALGFLYALWTLYGAGLETTGWGALLLGSGIPVYWLMKRRRA